MKPAFVIVALLSGLFSACGSSAVVTAPSNPVAAAAAAAGSITLSPQVISAISGTWNGTTAPVGSGIAGRLSITFNSSAPGSVAASITWTAEQSSTQYTGTAAGTLDNLVVSGLGPLAACGYKASGAITGSTYAGTYERTGSGCGSDSGTFSTLKQ